MFSVTLNNLQCLPKDLNLSSEELKRRNLLRMYMKNEKVFNGGYAYIKGLLLDPPTVLLPNINVKVDKTTKPVPGAIICIDDSTGNSYLIDSADKYYGWDKFGKTIYQNLDVKSLRKAASETFCLYKDDADFPNYITFGDMELYVHPMFTESKLFDDLVCDRFKMKPYAPKVLYQDIMKAFSRDTQLFLLEGDFDCSYDVDVPDGEYYAIDNSRRLFGVLKLKDDTVTINVMRIDFTLNLKMPSDDTIRKFGENLMSILSYRYAPVRAVATSDKSFTGRQHVKIINSDTSMASVSDIIINPLVKKIYDKPTEKRVPTGTHASPCEHFRRATMRKLKSGKVVPVKATTVNKGKNKDKKIVYTV